VGWYLSTAQPTPPSCASALLLSLDLPLRQLDNSQRHDRSLEYRLIPAESPKVLDDLAEEECDQAGVDEYPEVGGPELPVDQIRQRWGGKRLSVSTGDVSAVSMSGGRTFEPFDRHYPVCGQYKGKWKWYSPGDTCLLLSAEKTQSAPGRVSNGPWKEDRVAAASD